MEFLVNYLFYGLLIISTINITASLIWGVVLAIKWLKYLFEERS